LGDYLGGNSAARSEFRSNLHPSRAACTGEVVEYIICEGLVKDSFVTEALHIELEAFQLDTYFIGAVFDYNLAEIRLAGFWAEAGKFGAVDGDGVIALGARVVKKLKFVFFAHLLSLAKASLK